MHTPIAVALTSLAAASCSLIAVPPPRPPTQERPAVSCEDSEVPMAIDAVVALAFAATAGIAAGALAANRQPGHEDLHPPVKPLIRLGIAGAAVFGASATIGSSRSTRCSELKRDHRWSARAAQDPTAGTAGHLCRPTARRCDTGLGCVRGQCVPAGGQGQPCVPRPEFGEGAVSCQAGLVCTADRICKAHR